MKLAGCWIAGVFSVLLAATPQEASAQCTASCACSTRSCQCSTTGGKGAGCETDGESCIVLRCGVVLPTQYFVAPNGLLFRTAASEGDAQDAEPTLPAPQDPTAWETVEPGHYVRRNCVGIVVEEWFDPAAAERVRAQSRTIEI
jgi:hypothetical protein